jgi:glutathione S-transferase
MFRVLGRRTSSNVQKVLWCLAEMGHAFEQEDYGGPFGKTRDAAYLQMNPNATVPTCIDGDVVLWESNTILRYLCNTERCETLYPADTIRRAMVERWMDWQLGTIGDCFGRLYRGLVRERRSAADLETERFACARFIAILDDALANQAFIAGDALTLADIVLGPTIYRWLALDIARDDLTHVASWYERLTLRSAYRDYVMVGLH